MYLYDTLKGESAISLCQQILKLNPAEFSTQPIDRIEVFATSFTDDGDDYCEYRIFDCDNNLVAVRREPGY